MVGVANRSFVKYCLAGIGGTGYGRLGWLGELGLDVVEHGELAISTYWYIIEVAVLGVVDMENECRKVDIHAPHCVVADETTTSLLEVGA